MRLSLVSLCLFSLVACGGDDGDTMLVDAGPGSADAPPASNCTVSPSYSTTFDMNNAFAETNGAGTEQELVGGGFLNMDAMPDALQIELYAGLGPFQNGITSQSITLAGDELDYATCAACVRVFTDLTEDSSGGEYFATGGTLNLTSVENTLKFTLTNVTLQHVTITSGTWETTPVGDGCTTTLTDVTFSAPIEQPQARSKNGPIRLRAQRVSKH